MSNIILSETKVDDTILSGFTIRSVDSSVGDKNGERVYHLQSEGEEYSLKVSVKNGKKEGKGMVIRKDGRRYLSVHFKGDVIDGEVRKYDEYDNMILKGMIVGGKESGLFIEYDQKGTPLWYGYYLHGQRYKELTKSNEMKGFYEERDSSGLTIVSQFNANHLCKDGVSYELKNGQILRVCEYSEGVFQRVLMTTKNGVLTEYDENGSRRYEGGYSGNMKRGLKREGKGTEYGKDGETVVCIGEWSKGKRNGDFVIYKNHKVVSREHWENGRKVMVLLRQCKHVIWSVVGVLVLSSLVYLLVSYLESLKQVSFQSCDELLNYPVKKRKHVKQLIFANGFECEGDVDLHEYVKCKRLEIGDEAMTKTTRIDIDGLIRLKEVIIGDGSFGLLSELVVKGSRYEQLESVQIGSNALNALTSIPLTAFSNLITIVIGSSSLNRLTSLQLSSTTTLRSLTIGSSSLQKLNRFRMSEYSNLESVRIGSNSLISVNEMELNGLWNLNQLEIDEGGLSGLEKVVLRDAKMRTLSPLGLNTCLSDKCLMYGKSYVVNRVRRFEIGENSNKNVDMVSVSGVDGLESLVIGGHSLSGTGIAESVLELTNCSSLRSIEIGWNSLSSYKRLELSGLPSLVSIVIGNSCLSLVGTVHLSGDNMM